MGKTGRQGLTSTQPTAVSAVVAQVGGTHYGGVTTGVCPHCFKEIQHWDLYAKQPYLESQVSRYILRWQQKGGFEDLLKAQSFLNKIIALHQASCAPVPKAGGK